MSEPPRKLIIDCDPGVDDAIALLLALAARQQLELLAIATVAGNAALPLTSRNARLICELAGRRDVPVYAGCPRPMVREPVDAGDFHGATGLGPLSIHEPDVPLAPEHAVQALIRILRTEPTGSVTLAMLGPMTNLALAMVMAPDIVGRIGEIVVMAGARSEGGNITASAEYNVYADPHAARVVFRSGCRIATFGLDATHQVRATTAHVAAIRRLDTPPARATARLLEFTRSLEPYVSHAEGAPLHDPCTIAYLLQPELFRLQPCTLEVETASPLTLGHTAVEFRPGHEPMTTHWAVSADGPAVFDLLTRELAKL